jgi:hypothetical protein
MQAQERMYENTGTWNPAVGCEWGCVYCKDSFQAILKRFMGKKCEGCKTYKPHYHPERLNRIPSGKQNIFVFGNGDIAFYDEEFVIKTIMLIPAYISRHPNNAKKTFYFQSKDPLVFEKYLDYFKTIPNITLITTLETNRDEGYNKISKAPPPSERALDFKTLDFPRKIVTVEPILDFDLGDFFWMLKNINPLMIYMGYNSRPKKITLPEPSLEKFYGLKKLLTTAGIEVVLKNKDRLKAEEIK